MNDRNSFKNASTKWLQEVKTCAMTAPCILVGTKSDLRKEADEKLEKDIELDGSSHVNPNAFVTKEQLMDAAQKFNFQGAVECSSKNFQDS